MIVLQELLGKDVDVDAFFKTFFDSEEIENGYYPVVVKNSYPSSNKRGNFIRLRLVFLNNGVSFDNKEIKTRKDSFIFADYYNLKFFFLETNKISDDLLSFEEFMKISEKDIDLATEYLMTLVKELLLDSKFYIKLDGNKPIRILSKEEERELGLPPIEKTSK